MVTPFLKSYTNFMAGFGKILPQNVLFLFRILQNFNKHLGILFALISSLLIFFYV